MNLMLVVIFACVAIGLFARRFGPREYCLVAVVACAMTLLYFLFSERFM
jgi:hypothetical protein